MFNLKSVDCFPKSRVVLFVHLICSPKICQLKNEIHSSYFFLFYAILLVVYVCKEVYATIAIRR
jgi:hypothetical protein